VRPVIFLVVIVVLFAVMASAAFLSGEPTFAIPVALVGLIVVVLWSLMRLNAYQALKRHGNSPEAASSDADDPVPSTDTIADDATALGDTAQAHAEINPHDFPKGSPERAAVEELAQETARGTTSGHADPAEREGRVGPVPGKAEGYPDGRPASSPRGRS
jgi:hypothetical protein